MQDNNATLQLTKVTIKNFRCFSHVTFDLEGPILLIDGVNGSGKTSLLEALHYLCYLRSFRTHTPRDLVRFEQDGFFIKGSFNSTSLDTSLDNEIQVGFANKKRLVKINSKAVCSYKELMDFYRVITLTEDDLALIKGGPDMRRSFLDQAILLQEPGFMATLRAYKQVVDNRNTLLQTGRHDPDLYRVWTKQLWEKTREIQQCRMEMLSWFEKEVNKLLKEHFEENLEVSLVYKPKKVDLIDSFDTFIQQYGHISNDEYRYGRSLFGAHLDDFLINFRNKKSKTYASRGQQKLITVLIKIAQVRQLSLQKGPSIFLLDDFMTDFDEKRVEVLLSILSDMKMQLIFTTPATHGFLEKKLLEMGARRINISN